MALHVDIFENPLAKLEFWLCAVVQPSREFYVAANLEYAGFEVYLPVTQITRNSLKSLISLFGGYLFVKNHRNLAKLLKIDGVTGIITRNNEPICVRPEVIAELRSREHRGIIPTETAISQNLGFAHGEPIRLTQGAQSGLLGTFERMLGRHRASVYVHSAGRTARVSVPICGVVAQACMQLQGQHASR